MNLKTKFFLILLPILLVFNTAVNAKIKSYYFTKDYMVVSGRYNLPKADAKCSNSMVLNEVNVSNEFLRQTLADRDQFSNSLSEAFNKSLSNYGYKSDVVNIENNNYLTIDLKDPVVTNNNGHYLIQLSATVYSKDEKRYITHSINSSHSIYVYEEHGKAASVAVGVTELFGIGGVRQATAKNKPKYPTYDPNSIAAWEGNGSSYYKSNDDRLIINVGIERSLQSLIANYIYKLSANTDC